MNKIPPDFEWRTYLDINTDLNRCNEEDAKKHYLNHGIYEKRKYKKDLPVDFDWQIYLELNQDIDQKSNEKNVIYHYLNHGIYEKRKYKKNVHEDTPDIDQKSNEKMKHKKNVHEDSPDIEIDTIQPYKRINYNMQNYNTYECIDYCENSCINENEIKYNLPRGQHNFKPKININLLDTFILIIDFHNGGGGTTTFIENIVTRYKKYQTFLIARNFNNDVYFTVNDEYELETPSYNNKEASDFLYVNKHKIEKIFVNHFYKHSLDFINSLYYLNVKITTITHDLFLLFNEAQIKFNDIDSFFIDKTKRSYININIFDTIITQNIANMVLYDNFIENKNKIIVSSLPDFKKPQTLITTSNDNIVIGLIGEISEKKGQNELIKIINYYKNTNIKFVVFGRTHTNICEHCYQYQNINELNQLLKIHKPNIILELSIWPETYSYTLSLAMITQLPILYLKKNNYCVVEERLSKYEKAHSFTNINELDKLIKDKKQNYFYTIEPIIYFNNFWDNYFITKKEKKNIKKNANKYDILPYVIYFPQFHEIRENNISFYPGFSDVKNLELLKNKNMCIDVETPSLKEFQLTNISEYDYIKKKEILQKQIDIIYDYNIAGFAIYYYWFSINTITNQNLIMENVINQFFDGSIDMKDRKCFLMWANESWTSNPAFGQTNEMIETDYTNENLINISINLLSYFKNDNYLKIDNKPVFELHHPWMMTTENVNMFYNILNYICLDNNFNGIHFIVNSTNGNYENYINRCHHFNYKKCHSRYYDETLNQIFVDYKKYIHYDINDHTIDNEIQTLVFDFDNRARLCQPDKLNKSTVCINNTEIDKILFMKKIINKYIKNKNSDVENILLVNSWNEWGEKMCMEPSQEYGFYYLNLLNNILENN